MAQRWAIPAGRSGWCRWAAGAARLPAGKVTQVFATSADREGAFRLLENDAVPSSRVAPSIFDATARGCSEEPFVEQQPIVNGANCNQQLFLERECNDEPTVVLAEEVGYAGKDRIRWTLLTTAPVKKSKEARAVVFGYSMRWRIEDFHRTWIGLNQMSCGRSQTAPSKRDLLVSERSGTSKSNPALGPHVDVRATTFDGPQAVYFSSEYASSLRNSQVEVKRKRLTHWSRHVVQLGPPGSARSADPKQLFSLVVSPNGDTERSAPRATKRIQPGHDFAHATSRRFRVAFGARGALATTKLAASIQARALVITDGFVSAASRSTYGLARVGGSGEG